MYLHDLNVIIIMNIRATIFFSRFLKIETRRAFSKAKNVNSSYTLLNTLIQLSRYCLKFRVQQCGMWDKTSHSEASDRHISCGTYECREEFWLIDNVSCLPGICNISLPVPQSSSRAIAWCRSRVRGRNQTKSCHRDYRAASLVSCPCRRILSR